MKDRTSKTNLLENGKNYPMKIQEAIIRVENNNVVDASDSRTASFKTIDLGNVIGHYSDFSDKVFEIISRDYWQELADDMSDGNKQIDYDYFTGDHYEYEGDLQADEALITAKVRNIGIDSEYDIFIEVKAKLPDTNILIPKY
jgi:hypothetical protein